MNFWHDVRLMNLAANALTAVALGAMLAGAGWWLAQRPMFALRTVVIEPAGESLATRTPSQNLLPDSELVYSPSAVNFDIDAFVQEAGGYLASYQEWHKSTGMKTGAEIVAARGDREFDQSAPAAGIARIP